MIVDEGGQVPLSLWGALNAYRSANGCNLIVMGDFAGQSPPIADHENFDVWKQFPHSAVMHDMCGGFRVCLNKVRRRKWLHGDTFTPGDYPHFEMTCGLYPNLDAASKQQSITPVG